MVSISCFAYIKYVVVALTRKKKKGSREFDSDVEGSKRDFYIFSGPIHQAIKLIFKHKR